LTVDIKLTPVANILKSIVRNDMTFSKQFALILYSTTRHITYDKYIGDSLDIRCGIDDMENHEFCYKY